MNMKFTELFQNQKPLIGMIHTNCTSHDTGNVNEEYINKMIEKYAR